MDVIVLLVQKLFHQANVNEEDHCEVKSCMRTGKEKS
jgi:hypothetical protein